MVLSDGVAGEEFLNEAFDFAVAAAEAFALFGFEHNVLHGFHFGGRAGQSALVEVGVDVGMNRYNPRKKKKTPKPEETAEPRTEETT